VGVPLGSTPALVYRPGQHARTPAGGADNSAGRHARRAGRPVFGEFQSLYLFEERPTFELHPFSGQVLTLRGGFHYYPGLNRPDLRYGGLCSHLLFRDEESSVEREHLGADCTGDRVVRADTDDGKDSCGILIQEPLTRMLGLADGRRRTDRTAAARAVC